MSVLDGGFPALVQKLLDLRGSVEPIIINFEMTKWEAFLVSTGRMTDMNNRKMPSSTPVASAEKISFRTGEINTTEQRYQLALSVAKKLGHGNMQRFLQSKISENFDPATLSTTTVV